MLRHPSPNTSHHNLAHLTRLVGPFGSFCLFCLFPGPSSLLLGNIQENADDCDPCLRLASCLPSCVRVCVCVLGVNFNGLGPSVAHLWLKNFQRHPCHRNLENSSRTHCRSRAVLHQASCHPPRQRFQTLSVGLLQFRSPGFSCGRMERFTCTIGRLEVLALARPLYNPKGQSSAFGSRRKLGK